MGTGKITLKFILGGKEYAIPNVEPHSALRAAIEKAFNEAGETGRRDLKEWLVKTEAGTELDPNSSSLDLGLKDGDVVYLSLRSGAGG